MLVEASCREGGTTCTHLLAKATVYSRCAASAALVDNTSRQLVELDAWNTLDHERGGLSETDHVCNVLTKVIRLVVHLAKMQRNRDGKRPIPTPYDYRAASRGEWPTPAPPGRPR